MSSEVSGWSRLYLWRSTILRVIGALMALFSLAFLFPAGYAFILNEDPYLFLMPIVLFLPAGVLLFLISGPTKNFRTVNGIILIALVWATMFAEASAPYFLVGMQPIDAIFESVSGITTTGSSTIDDVYLYPASLVVWRSITQWLGGIAVVIIFIYILPMFGMGRTFFSNELEGSGSSQYSVKLRNAARSFILVYVGFTVVNFILLLICQAEMEDALCLAFTTVSTGGLIVSNTSLMDMNIWVQIVTMIFMFIGGVNFYLHFKAVYGKNPGEYTRNHEFKMLLIWFLILSVVVFVLADYQKFMTTGLDLEVLLTDYKNALFTAISLGTTTGSAVYDYTQYPVSVMVILIVVMLIGASAGSTSGGIKFTRMRLVLGFFNNSLKSVLHPNGVYSVKVDGETIADSRVLSAVSITLLYLLTTFASMIFLLSQGLSWQDSIGLAAGTISNTGVGFGDYGPVSSFSSLSPTVKIFLMFMMWVGRLEITMALVFFTKTFWHDVRYSVRSNRNTPKDLKDEED